MSITPDEIARLRGLCERATAGPWKRDQSRKGTQNQSVESLVDLVCTYNDKKISSVHINAWKQGQRNAIPDAEFIAASRTALPSLLDEVERLREALTKLRDCDFVISLPDRMDAVREIARKALEGK